MCIHTNAHVQSSSFIFPIQGSTTSHDDLQRAVDQVTKETGYIDVLVNNAGMTTWDGSPNARAIPTAESSAAEVQQCHNPCRWERWVPLQLFLSRTGVLIDPTDWELIQSTCIQVYRHAADRREQRRLVVVSPHRPVRSPGTGVASLIAASAFV